MIFENLIIDRPIAGVFRNDAGEVLGGLNQIQNLSINTTSESKNKTDAQGALIKRFFTSKAVEITAENAVFSLSLMGLQTASGKQAATATNKIDIPMIKKYKKTDSPITLPATPIDGTFSVTGLTPDGLPDISLNYVKGTEAGPGTYTLSGSTLTLPTDATDYVQVVYDYQSENGAKVIQRSDKFPNECEFTLSVLVCDACDKEKVRVAYIKFPAFQMNPDFDLSVDTESAHPFSGSAAVNYCSPDKQLFYIAISEDDLAD